MSLDLAELALRANSGCLCTEGTLILAPVSPTLHEREENESLNKVEMLGHPCSGYIRKSEHGGFKRLV